MASESLVTEQFQFLGIDIEKEVLNKCVSLCEVYGIDAETLVELWMAFSLSHLNGSSPNLENLELLERKEFSKRMVERCNASVKDAIGPGAGTSVMVYDAPIAVHFLYAQENMTFRADFFCILQELQEVFTKYIKDTSKRLKSDVESVPNQNELGPATYSPKISHSAKYASRSNAGTVVHSFGADDLLQRFTDVNSQHNALNLNIAQVPNDDGDVYTKAMFGFELLHEKASTFSNHISYISQSIMKKAALTDAKSVRHKTQTEVVVCGRIECDADARLNPKCVVLQGTWEESLSQAVPVDLDNLKQYSLFPGQVVAMRGANPRGDRFIASEVFSDASLPVPDARADILNSLTGTMSIVVAAGPYTTSDNLAYEPLKDLLAYIGTNKPHVVFMTGPFLDCDHSKVKDNSMAETYRTFFEKIIDSLGELNTTSPNTSVYIVSSQRDAFHVSVYPTPAYPCRRRPAAVRLLPDPCTVDVAGVRLGLTSTDVLMHVSHEEISLGVGGDKLARLAGHVLSQQSYYPLWPAAALAVDAPLWAAHAQLPCTPHVLVLPSNFRYFVKEVNGCVVVNPEHLAKGVGGGTFARLLVAADREHAINIAAQIVRI